MPEGTETVSLNKVPDFPAVWNVPYQRNPFFTGREDILKRLHTTLTSGKTAALTQPQAISGLGGIGKTQTAVEYVYRYGGKYEAVLWVKADTREVLISDFVSIADLLNLPEKNEQDQNRVVNAVKRWLQTHTDWLLIFDNVEDLKMVKEFIASAGKGHILLTTRTQATEPIAKHLPINQMEQEEGAQFLLRRAEITEKEASLNNASIDNQAKAKEISQVMDGLPLALDQAGAYIYETNCSLLDYLKLYQTERITLLKKRGEFDSGHSEPVATTWSISFQKVEQANSAAADLLRLCAFLSPDAIPEEIITKGAPDLGRNLELVGTNPLKLNNAIGELLKMTRQNHSIWRL